MRDTTSERIAIATRGVRYPAELADLLTWAAYNNADRQARRELCSLPWRRYQDLGDVVDQIGRTRLEVAARHPVE
ncbi:MAG TPA: DUF2795 domain-containing protein [Pseudonocardia sp.]|jgi:hypothetical protein|nr:DUF2795 domain-containing protein [Pseudonocardia sp.]